jgi:allantoin racemase
MPHACQPGQRTGIVTINPRYISWFHHQIRKHELEHRVTGVRAMSFELGEILRAYDSNDLANDVERKYAEQARPLVAQGVEVLIPGGGIPIVVKATETAVKLRRLTGLGVSRTSDYVKPPPHVIEEFLTHPKGL